MFQCLHYSDSGDIHCYPLLMGIQLYIYAVSTINSMESIFLTTMLAYIIIPVILIHYH